MSSPCRRAAEVLLAAALLAGCQRETRAIKNTPESGPGAVATSTLVPGATPQEAPDRRGQAYEGNSFHISQGQKYFRWFNCNGCHSNGGGGMGPPLMDNTWIYGSDPGQVFASIVQGRPNGMPSFRGKLSNDQVWQLVAYVRSLSGLGRRDVRGGRDDHMYGKSSEQNTNNRPPRTTGVSSSSEFP